MPLITAHESAIDNGSDIDKLKSKVSVSHVELVATAKPPVADNFMYDFRYNHPLPTSDVLGIKIPTNCDAQKEAATIVARLSEVMGKGDAPAFTDMFLEYGEFSPRAQSSHTSTMYD